MATFGGPQISIIYKNRPLVCLVPNESSSTYSVRNIFMLSHVIHNLLVVFIGWQSFPSFCNRQAVSSIAVRSYGHKLRLCYQPKFYKEIWQFPVSLNTVCLGTPSTYPFVCVLNYWALSYSSISTSCNFADWMCLRTRKILSGWAKHEGVPLGVCDVSANVTFVICVMAPLRDTGRNDVI